MACLDAVQPLWLTGADIPVTSESLCNKPVGATGAPSHGMSLAHWLIPASSEAAAGGASQGESFYDTNTYPDSQTRQTPYS